MDLESWHTYGIRWTEDSVRFLLDGHQVLETAVVPRPPLGIVIWMDNQFAAFHPGGQIAWGFEGSDGAGSLEVSDLQLEVGSS